MDKSEYNPNPGGVDIIGEDNKSKVTTKEDIINTLDNFLQNYSNVQFTIGNELLLTIKKKLSRCRSEFDSNRFFVLVVGPVKSGKSTFVNILTRSDMSPTDCLECTAVPTVIGESNEPDKISCIVPNQELDDADKCELFDEIIDVIRGIESPDSLQQKISVTKRDATSDNVKEIVTLSRKEEKRPMIATIGIRRTDFIDDQVLLIDMPGLDGMGANEHDPLYRRMIERADFIFFVQSSTSAINEATNEFLRWLLMNNMNSIPFRLIHNLHDSHYFLREDIRKDIIERQLENGRKCLKETFGITKDFDSFVMNFAKIYNGLMSEDNVENDNLDDVVDCKDEYLRVERQILDSMKAQRQAIKDRNNIDKSNSQLQNSIALLKEIKIMAGNRMAEIRNVISNLENIEQPIKGTGIDINVLREKIASLLSKNGILDTLQRMIDACEIQPMTMDRMAGKALKEVIKSMADAFSSFTGLNGMSTFHSNLCKLLSEEFEAVFKGEIDAIKQAFSQNDKDCEISLPFSLDFTSLPLSIPAFEVDCFDIQDHRVIRGPYRQTEQMFYLNKYKQKCRNNASAHLDKYLNNVINSVSGIRDSFIEGVITSIETERKRIVNMCTLELESLSQQEKTIEMMIGALGGPTNK